MKIGQAAQLTGLTISNIRFYERKGLLEPERNDQSKYRNYSEQDIRRLKQIILYRKMNMPILKSREGWFNPEKASKNIKITFVAFFCRVFLRRDTFYFVLAVHRRFFASYWQCNSAFAMLFCFIRIFRY